MAIISANRYSQMNGNYIIAANENYGIEDMGRILMENEMNDMAIFNAVLKSDMYEIKARTEGTLLESEIQAMNENSIKEFGKAIVEKLKKVWAKIKGMIKSAIANISAYVVRNGKAFVAMHRKDIMNLKPDTKIGTVWIPENNDYSLASDIKGMENALKDIDYKSIISAASSNELSATEVTKSILKGIVEYDDGNFYEAYKKDIMKEIKNATVRDIDRSAMMAALENGNAPIKAIKSFEKAAESKIKAAIKEIESASKDARAAMEKDEDKEAESKKLKAMQTYANGMSSAISTIAKADIKLVKFSLAQARKALARAIGNQATTESTLLESMLLEADEDMETMDNDSASDLTPEEAEEVAEILVKAAEELEDSADDDE